mmetsp:Transcript_11947/g.20750  ORF Transcript_11947/g.20750 Transcript_11947/m.20750 type:complete len:107 (-) Transcript_11947:319-639(-)
MIHFPTATPAQKTEKNDNSCCDPRFSQNHSSLADNEPMTSVPPNISPLSSKPSVIQRDDHIINQNEDNTSGEFRKRPGFRLSGFRLFSKLNKNKDADDSLDRSEKG